MDKAHVALMKAEEISQAFKTALLDQAYERTLQQTERIYDDERTRSLRVQQMLLKFDNDSLQQQLTEAEAQVDDLEDRDESTREQLVQLDSDLLQAQNDIRTRAREVERYRAELTAMDAMTSDSAKLLTEKLALAREVATLKPEIEHLRSQGALNQNALSEKLALQRELSSVHVELETERRAVQRSKANSSKSAETDSKLATQVEDLKKDMAKERKEAQKHDREAQKHAMEWESQKAILESKLDAFRNKLRSTKEQLKDSQRELDEAQAAMVMQKPEPTQAAGARPRKRQTAHFDPDATMGTPRYNGVHAAKRARMSTLPGDKSTFSITPFLNRTMSILPDSPEATELQSKTDEPTNTQRVDPESSSPSATQTTIPLNPPPALKIKETRILQENKTASRANGIVPPRKQATTAKKSFTLTKVVEMSDVENDEGADTVPELTQVTKTIKPAPKKKQKLLGQRKSLFDDDDAEETRSRARTVGLLGSSRGLGLRGGGGFSGGIGAISLGGKGKGKVLSEFSPLKKDRRASEVSS